MGANTFLMTCRLLTFLFACCLFVSADVAFGQTVSMAAELPKNPEALLNLGRGLNGLTDSALIPWHIKVTTRRMTMQVSRRAMAFSRSGGPARSSIGAVFRARPFHQVEYVTDTGTYRAGSSAAAPEAESMLVIYAFLPIGS